MKKVYISLLFIFILTNKIEANNWLTSFDEAKKIALASNKLLLVDFWASWCGPCKKMDAESWSKEDVNLLMQNYIPVQINIDYNKDLAQKYGVKGIPFVFIMDPTGKVLYKQMSYKTKSQVIDLLNKYALDTSFLTPYILSYYKNQNFTSAFRLATKYNDFSVFAKKEIRNDILNVSNEYFDISKRFLKKSNLENKNAFLQQIHLYQIQEKFILNKTDKANKLLKKLKNENINKINKQLFFRLNYISCKKMNDSKKEEYWYQKLNDTNKKKVQLIFKLS